MYSFLKTLNLGTIRVRKQNYNALQNYPNRTAKEFIEFAILANSGDAPISI